MLFVRWDATGFECLAKEPGRRLASLLPQLWPVPSGDLERGHGAWAKASCLGSAAITSTHWRQLGIFMRRKPFQSVRGGGGGKKNPKTKQPTGGNICF